MQNFLLPFYWTSKIIMKTHKDWHQFFIANGFERCLLIWLIKQKYISAAYRSLFLSSLLHPNSIFLQSMWGKKYRPPLKKVQFSLNFHSFWIASQLCFIFFIGEPVKNNVCSLQKYSLLLLNYCETHDTCQRLTAKLSAWNFTLIELPNQTKWLCWYMISLIYDICTFIHHFPFTSFGVLQQTGQHVRVKWRTVDRNQDLFKTSPTVIPNLNLYPSPHLNASHSTPFKS